MRDMPTTSHNEQKRDPHLELGTIGPPLEGTSGRLHNPLRSKGWLTPPLPRTDKVSGSRLLCLIRAWYTSAEASGAFTCSLECHTRVPNGTGYFLHTTTQENTLVD